MFICDKCRYSTEIKSNFVRHINRKTDCTPSVKRRSLRYAWLFLSLIGVITIRSRKPKK